MSNNVSGAEFEQVMSAGVRVCVDSIAQLELYAARLNALTHRSAANVENRGSQAPDYSGAHEVYLRVNPGEGAGHHEKVITAGKVC